MCIRDSRTAILTAVTAAAALQSCTEPAESLDGIESAITSTEEAVVTSAEEAAAEAASTITEANADAELEKLMGEIESELDG